MTNYPVSLLADFYKLGHREQYPKGTQNVFSTFTPRSNRFMPEASEVVVFGVQAFVKKFLIEAFNESFFNRPKEEVLAEYVRMVSYGLGKKEVVTTHLEELHDLGYLPIRLRSMPEGSLVPLRVPVLTIENTKPEMFWITNFLETMMSAALWQPMTSATVSHQYRKLLDEYAIKTTGNTDAVPFMAHDFSMRGMSSVESAETSGAGHLLSFTGSDTIPAILHLEKYYNANMENEFIGGSISATEHSVMCSYGQTSELELFRHLLTEVYPTDAFSVVSDTWDFWKVVEEYLPALKSEIMSRDGKLVIRPDSGNPVSILCGTKDYDSDLTEHLEQAYPNGDYSEEGLHEILTDAAKDLAHKSALEDCEGRGNCGSDEYGFNIKVYDNICRVTVEVEYDRHDKQYYFPDSTSVSDISDVEQTVKDKGLVEALWDIFGGTINEQGYKILDSHIGAIYGDSITLERAKQICSKLESKGFASTNVVFGVGAYSFQYRTRDSLGFAMKATYVVVDGEERLIFKDPKTDDGTKKSQRGRVVVAQTDEGIVFVDDLNRAEYDAALADGTDLMQDVFVDGQLVFDDSLQAIRTRLQENTQKKQGNK